MTLTPCYDLNIGDKVRMQNKLTSPLHTVIGTSKNGKTIEFRDESGNVTRMSVMLQVFKSN